MEYIRYYFGLYWNSVLDWPLRLLNDTLGWDWQAGGRAILFKSGITLFFLVVLYGLLTGFLSFLRRRRNQRGYAAVSEEDRSLSETTSEADLPESGAFTEDQLALLKKQGKWAELGKACSAMNRSREAADAFRKAGDLKQAALELAKTGKEMAAARLLEKSGEYAQAAKLYGKNGKYRKAIRALKKIGDLPGMGVSYLRWGKYAQGVDAFLEYFSATADPQEKQVLAAEQCYLALELEKAKKAVSRDKINAIQLDMARRFDAARRDEIAAPLYERSSDPGHAGEVYLRMGHLEKAAQCLQEAGRTREACEIRGRYHESKGQWKEAGAAYESCGLFLRAGDCFSKASEAMAAAQCYRNGGEFFGAGFALAYARNWEQAIPLLQQVKEDSPRYNESRALLGRCFYEMKDYAHCAAALDNHLTGARITKANIEYFWMLALAYEQMGELEKSRSVLQKIRTVDVAYRDISQRLSSIESRISIMGSGMMTQAATIRTAPAGVSDGVSQMIEKSLGNRYAIERELGRGGMGVVYLARDTQLDRPVALKFLGSMVDDSDEFKQRFVREAKAAAKVTHPNIVSIYDIGAQEGSAYIAMEYVEGASLSRYVLAKGRLPIRESVNIMLQVCSALDAIHQAQIVHRDIKPDNVLIGRGGLVKLMDFGLAKMENARLTAPGCIMGTPAYMSPEQVRGLDVDVRSDIYSLGLVFYELLTGKVAFEGANVINRQLTEMPPRPCAVAGDVPEALDSMVMRCIAKKPEERFASVQELTVALRNAAQ